MIKFIIKLLNFWDKFGFLGIVSLIYPVYWSQDIEFKNNGRDILSLKYSEDVYFYGTWQQLTKYLEWDNHVS